MSCHNCSGCKDFIDAKCVKYSGPNFECLEFTSPTDFETLVGAMASKLCSLDDSSCEICLPIGETDGQHIVWEDNNWVLEDACSTIFVPVTTYDFNEPWTDIFPLDGSVQFEFEVDGVTHILGNPTTIESLETMLEVYGDVEFTDETFTITGFHVYGDLTTDSSPFISPSDDLSYVEGTGSACEILFSHETILTQDKYHFVFGNDDQGLVTEPYFYYDWDTQFLTIGNSLPGSATGFAILGNGDLDLGASHPYLRFHTQVSSDTRFSNFTTQCGFESVAGGDPEPYAQFYSARGTSGALLRVYGAGHIDIFNGGGTPPTLRFMEDFTNNTGNNYIEFRAAASITNNWTIVWPTDTPSGGESLKVSSVVGQVVTLEWA